MKIISVIGKRGSGKTGTAIHIANELAKQGFKVAIQIEGPARYAQDCRRELLSNVTIIFPNENCRGDRRIFDYYIYDGYRHPESNQLYNCSPYI